MSFQLLPATVRCVNYIWPGKSAAGGIFKPSRPPVCRLLWRSLSDFASFSWECRVPGGSRRCWAVYFLPSTTQPLGPGLTSRDLGSSRPCVCAREGLKPAVITVRLSGCQLQNDIFFVISAKWGDFPSQPSVAIKPGRTSLKACPPAKRVARLKVPVRTFRGNGTASSYSECSAAEFVWGRCITQSPGTCPVSPVPFSEWSEEAYGGRWAAPERQRPRRLSIQLGPAGFVGEGCARPLGVCVWCGALARQKPWEGNTGKAEGNAQATGKAGLKKRWGRNMSPKISWGHRNQMEGEGSQWWNPGQ